MRQYTFIVNPAAGKRARRQQSLVGQIAALAPDAEVLLTTRPGEARLLAGERSMRDGHVVVAVGGDGTVHEVACGLVGGRALLAVVPVGSGNDFARMLASPRELEAALAWFDRAGPRDCDVGQVRIEHADGRIDESHFINSLGIGFEAVVAETAASARFFRGFSRYLVAALIHLWRYRGPQMTIRMEDQIIEGAQFLIALGNGRTAGGGFRLTPHAKIDDGLLDICRAEELSVLRRLMILPTVLFGTHFRFSGIHDGRVDRIGVDCPTGCMVHGDGEIVAREAVRIEVSLHSGGLRLLG